MPRGAAPADRCAHQTRSGDRPHFEEGDIGVISGPRLRGVADRQRATIEANGLSRPDLSERPRLGDHLSRHFEFKPKIQRGQLPTP